MDDKEHKEALFRLEAIKQVLNLTGINSGFPNAKPMSIDDMIKQSHEVFRYIKLGATPTDPCK